VKVARYVLVLGQRFPYETCFRHIVKSAQKHFNHILLPQGVRSIIVTCF